MLRHKSAFQIGKKYLLRGSDRFYTGSLVKLTEKEFVLKDAVWLGEVSQIPKVLATGEMSGYEEFPDNLIVSRASIIEVTAFDHTLPNIKKKSAA